MVVPSYRSTSFISLLVYSRETHRMISHNIAGRLGEEGVFLLAGFNLDACLFSGRVELSISFRAVANFQAINVQFCYG